MARVALGFAVVVLGACGGDGGGGGTVAPSPPPAVAPPRPIEFSGTYLLRTINGQPIPFRRPTWGRHTVAATLTPLPSDDVVITQEFLSEDHRGREDAGRESLGWTLVRTADSVAFWILRTPGIDQKPSWVGRLARDSVVLVGQPAPPWLSGPEVWVFTH
jgi:hypothetical protein